VKNYKVIIIGLAFLLVISIAFNIKQTLTINEINRTTDNLFRELIIEANQGVALDFNNVSDEKQKSWYWNKGMANILAAAEISNMTKYAKTNKALNITLNNLYTLMADSSYQDRVKKEHQKLYILLVELGIHPEDSEITQKILEFTTEIRDGN
jgi:hypothetical protein